MTPLLTADTLAGFQARADLGLVRIADTLKRRCPDCSGVASETARSCGSAGDPTDGATLGLRSGPVCRFALVELARRHGDDRVRDRADRLRRAGCLDDAVMASVPTASTPPRASVDSEGSALAMESADYFARHRTTHTLVISGATGAGKSFAAAWAVAAEHRPSLWLRATTLDSLERWREVERRAHQALLLVIDDLGQERTSESGWAVETLATLIVSRMDARDLRTVVTTNLDARQLVDRYGQRFASRMSRQDSGYVPIGTVDLRRAARRGQRSFVEVVRDDAEDAR